ncbi:EAL domain-containing protein [Roseomonas sp. BN140053]|uniref:bifunctional diguanylate cyclase/phosphodiesterase n=1 Tax=Roseomonas sp. BN140053 TaxID=3391898 RepID=UPI0039EB52AD
MSVLPSALLEVWRTEHSRQENLSEVPDNALRLAEIAAAEQRRILEGARQLLTALSMLPMIRDQDEASCGPALRRLREQFSLYTVIGAAGLDGKIWCSSARPGTDISDRPGFQRAVQTGNFAVGGYVVGRITGRRTLSLNLPVLEEDGRVAGVLNAGLDLDLLAEDLASREPAPGVSLTVADPDGIVLVDLPGGRQVGNHLPERLQSIIAGAQSGVIDTEWINGTRQIVGYVPAASSSNASFLVAVGLDYQRFVEDPYRQGPSLAVSAAVLAAALLAAWFFASRYIRRPIARLAAVTERWRQGDMTARAGRIDRNSEISQLGLAFDAMADAVAERERRMADMLESTTDTVWAVDSEWRVTFMNRRAQERVKGYELLGRVVWEVFPDIEVGPIGDAYRRAMTERVPTQITVFYEPLAGHFELNIFPSEEGGLVLFVREVTEEIRAREALLHQAYHDRLTGLPNRSCLTEMATRGEDGRQPKALLLLDFDGFKHVNDTLGHAAGDEVLRDAAARLADRLGERGRLARLGGDEFAVLLFEEEAAAGEAIADEMLSVLAQSPFAVRGRHFRITASAGLVRVPAGAPADPEALLSNADLALYRAKAAGKGKYCVFSEADRAEYEARWLLDDDIDRAVGQGEFELHYQPQMRLSDGALVGAEALIRWRHPTRGLLSPAFFLEALESSRHAGRMGNWILDEACRQTAAWRRAGLQLRIGVNLFGEQLTAGDLAGIVGTALAAHGLPPEALELELTENIALRQDKGEMLASLQALRARGVGIAFDDFGTGFASLTTLRDFPVTRLKIDRSFISGLPGATHDAAIVESVLVLAGRLGLEVIAEGIETEAQESFLAARGCPEGQGYRYGRPISAGEFLAACLTRKSTGNLSR